MADSIQRLNDQIRAKERELDSVGNKLAGATVGAALVRNSILGAAAGALLGREKADKQRLEKEIADLKRKIQDNERQISQLEQQQSQLRNAHESDKQRIKADTKQHWNDLERQKQGEQDPNKQRDLSNQISQLQNDENTKIRDADRQFDQKLNDLQGQIHRLTA